MEVDAVVVESEDVPNAIADEVAKLAIKKLVIGAPSRGMFTRYFYALEILNIFRPILARYIPYALVNKAVLGACRKPKGLSPKISSCAPSFCTVYTISKGKLSSIRPSDTDTVGSSRDDNSDTRSIISDSSYASSSQTGNAASPMPTLCLLIQNNESVMLPSQYLTLF